MFSKSKKKQSEKPITFSTSSITRTQNTITTATGFQTTTIQQRVSYQEIRSSSSSTSLSSSTLLNSSGSGLTRLSTERSSLPQIRSAFDRPIHNYEKKLKQPLKINEKVKPFEYPKLTFNDAQSFSPITTPKIGLQSNQFKTPNATSVLNSNLNSGFKPGIQINQFKPTENAFNSNPNNIFNNELNAKLEVKVKKTGIYYGDSLKVPTYNTKSPRKRGKLLLINNIEFKGKRREGADVDQTNIATLFKQIGFDVENHKNKTKADTERIVKSFAGDRDLKKYDICITVIMSHGTTIGEQTMIETIDEQVLPTEWVVQQFNGENCKGMSEKPKIFIFQCCRGENENSNIQTDAKMFQPPRKVQDILISYSTLPGFVAYRDPKLGSWYIQGLCKVFMEHAHDTHIEDLLKIVDSELSKLKAGSQRQTSSYENRGFKTCYLNPIK